MLFEYSYLREITGNGGSHWVSILFVVEGIYMGKCTKLKIGRFLDVYLSWVSRHSKSRQNRLYNVVRRLVRL